MWLFSTPWTAASQASLSSTISWSFLKLMSIESVMLSNHLIPFSFGFQSFPASWSFPMSWLFISSGQSIGASASVPPMNIQGWFPLPLTYLNSLKYKGLSRIFSSTIRFSSVQFSSVAQWGPTLCDPMDCSTPGLHVGHQLSELTQTMPIESVMPSKHLILCHPLLLLPSIFPSIRVFSSESAVHIRWPKYWSLSINISPSNERPGLISFKMDWLDLLAVQGIVKGLLQHHSSKASILWCSAFLMVQLSQPYMTTRKTIVLTI